MIYMELPAQEVLKPSVISNIQTQIDDYSPRLLQVAVICSNWYQGDVPQDLNKTMLSKHDLVSLGPPLHCPGYCLFHFQPFACFDVSTIIRNILDVS